MVKHMKNLKTFTGYIQLTNFQAFGCQATAFLSVNKLIVLFQKNRVLIREWPWIIICMTYRSGSP